MTVQEEEITNIFNQNEPDKTRNLAYKLYCQWSTARYQRWHHYSEWGAKVVEIPFVQAKSEPVEIMLDRTKSTGFKDMVSMESNKMQ